MDLEVGCKWLKSKIDDVDIYRHGGFPFYLLANSVLSFPTFHFHWCFTSFMLFHQCFIPSTAQDAKLYDNYSQRFIRSYENVVLVCDWSMW